MKRLLLTIILISISFVAAIGQDFGEPAAGAPAELEQFAFLVGRWHAEYEQKLADGRSVTGVADWRISYNLGGYALIDEWEYYNSKGKLALHGTMYRTYNPKDGHWNIVEQHSTDLTFQKMTARKEDKKMIMYGERKSSDNKTTHFRRVFSQITPDSFLWSYDVSTDGGKTWQEAVATMKCRRVE